MNVTRAVPARKHIVNDSFAVTEPGDQLMIFIVLVIQIARFVEETDFVRRFIIQR